MMNDLRTRLTVTLQTCSLVCAAWLLSATCAAAAPITVGTFEIFNDPDDPFAPTFVITNDSSFAGHPATFGDIHLLLDRLNLPTLDFLLTGTLAPGETMGDGLTDPDTFLSLISLTDVLDAYLTLTLFDPVTSLALAGTASLGPTDPPLCLNCTTRMSDFTNGSTLAIQFEPASEPVPEPASLILMGSGIAAWAVRRRRASR